MTALSTDTTISVISKLHTEIIMNQQGETIIFRTQIAFHTPM